MATRTKPDSRYTDDFGVERLRDDEPGAVDKVRENAPVVDHAMRMNERFAAQGGNQFSAGITYFSVMAIIPLAMLTFAIMAFILAARPELLDQVQQQISNGLPQDIAPMVNEVIAQAIEQRGAVAGIGGLTALWSGLGWMNNLRAGVSAMWLIEANAGGGFLMKKFKDLIALIGLLLALGVAFGVTAIGSSSLTRDVLARLGVDGFPGMTYVIFAVGLTVGIVANFLVFAWMIMMLPRTKVPRKSGLQAALIGALLFEVIKQLSTVIFGALLGNPAGAVFGPVIGLMLIFYLIWRIVLYLSAWAATTEESLAVAPSKAPEPAVIHVRSEVNDNPNTGATLGLGAALGAAVTGAAALLTRRR